MGTYQVIVGNLGTVYDGDNGSDAAVIYADYVLASLNGEGRVAHESVTMMCEGEEIYSLTFDGEC